MKNKFTKEQWIEALTAETEIEFWGYTYTFKPVICTDRLGDGEKLVWITPISQRPYFWMMFVDSKMDVSDDIDMDDLEQLIQMLEYEFGAHPYSEGIDIQSEEDFQEYLKESESTRICDTYEDYLEACKYPNIHWDGGFCGTIADFKTGECNEDWLEEVEQYFKNQSQ